MTRPWPWRTLTTPTVSGELARRREAVLLDLLATLVGIGVVAQLVQWLSPLIQPRNFAFWLNWLMALATTLAFYGLLRVARSGRHRLAAWAVCWLLSGLGLWLLLATGVGRPVWSFLFLVSLLLAALLLGSRESGLVLGLQLSGLTAAWWLETHGHGVPLLLDSRPSRTTIGDVIAPALLSLVTLRACWLYTREVVSIDELVSHDPVRSPLVRLRTKTLTVREIEVVQLVAEGLSNDQIAGRLFLSPRTVQTHIANARAKTGTPNRTALGVLAIREGLAALTPGANSNPTIATPVGE